MTLSMTHLSARGERQPHGNVIAFAAAGPRRFRREAHASDGPLGQILLFTGVRYERMSEDAEITPRRKRS